MSANDNVNSNRGLSRPSAKPKPAAKPRPNTTPAPPSPPRSSLPIETLSEQMVELSAELRADRSARGAWPQAIIERLAVLFREAKEQNAAQQQSEEAGWKKEQAAWQAERNTLSRSLNDSAHHLRALAVELQKRREEQIWGWTRAEWAAFLAGVMLTLILGACGAVIYGKFVP